MNGVTNLGTER